MYRVSIYNDPRGYEHKIPDQWVTAKALWIAEEVYQLINNDSDRKCYGIAIEECGKNGKFYSEIDFTAK